MHYDFRDTQVPMFEHPEGRAGAAHVFPDGPEWPLNDPLAHPECVDQPWIFEPEADDYMRAAAVTICSRCPFRVECLDYAVRHPVHGTWGGQFVTQGWRWAIRRKLRKAA